MLISLNINIKHRKHSSLYTSKYRIKTKRKQRYIERIATIKPGYNNNAAGFYYT
jgi:hypothetical protein